MYNLKVRSTDKMHYLNLVKHFFLDAYKLHLETLAALFVWSDPCCKRSQKPSKQLDILQLLKLTLPLTAVLSVKIEAWMVASKPCCADSVLERVVREDHKGSTDSHEFSACFYVGVRLVSSHMAFLCTSLLRKSFKWKWSFLDESWEMLLWKQLAMGP